MSLHLPDFRQDFLRSVTVCSMLHIDNRDSISHLESSGLYAKYTCQRGDALLWYCLEPMNDNETIHFHYHVDVFLEEAMPSSLLGYSEVGVDELKQKMEQLSGHMAGADLLGRFLVPVERLPRYGMLNVLLGVSTEACGTELELRGSKFALHGDMFTELEWCLDDEEEHIKGSLSGYGVVEFDEDFLTHAASNLSEGIECLVLEETNTNDATSDTTSDEPHHAAEG